MTYLQRENEKTLGELQRDLEGVRAAAREEKKAQMVLELVIEKRKRSVARMMSLFAPEAETSPEVQDELVAILEAVPPTILLEPQIPFRPIVLAIATGRLSAVREVNASNNNFVDDDTVVCLGHVLGWSAKAHNLETLVLGGTAVKCRGLTAVIDGAVARRERMGITSAPFTLHAFNTDMHEDPPEVQAALHQRVKEVVAKYSNISIEV